MELRPKLRKASSDTSPGSPAKVRRIDGLQWARGMAALLVVLCHAILHPLADVSSLARVLGELGVTLFFVISGFIMVFTTGAGSFDIGLFIRRRIIRVVPLYYIATLVVALTALVAPNLVKSTLFDAGHLITSMLFIPSYEPTTGFLLPLYKLGWTLNYEMFFYAAFAALGWVTLKVRAPAIVIAFFALAALGQTMTFDSAPMQFYTQFDVVAFAAGVLIGSARLRGGWKVPLPFVLAGTLAAIACVVVVSTLYGEMRLTLNGYILVIAACSLIIIILAGYERGGEHLLSRLGILLGDASYALYLFHLFVVSAIWWVVSKLIGDVTGSPLMFAAVVFLILLVSTIAAFFVHLMVEKPIIKILNRLFGTAHPNLSSPAPTSS